MHQSKNIKNMTKGMTPFLSPKWQPTIALRIVLLNSFMEFGIEEFELKPAACICM